MKRKLLKLCAFLIVPVLGTSTLETAFQPSDEESEPSEFEEIVVKIDGYIWETDETSLIDRPIELIP